VPNLFQTPNAFGNFLDTFVMRVIDVARGTG